MALPCARGQAGGRGPWSLKEFLLQLYQLRALWPWARLFPFLGLVSSLTSEDTSQLPGGVNERIR